MAAGTRAAADARDRLRQHRAAQHGCIKSAAFRQGLSETGYVDGQNVVIEHHSVEGSYDRLPALAADLVRRKPELMLVGNVTAALALRNATSTIPIVFVLGDPVADGVVARQSRCGIVPWSR